MRFRTTTEQMHADVKYAGGFTYSPLHPTPTAGYMVGFQPITTVSVDDVLPDAILADAIMQLKSSPLPLFIGGWADGPDAYYDISQHVPDLDVALSVARSRGELAIFDLLNMQEIRLEELKEELKEEAA